MQILDPTDERRPVRRQLASRRRAPSRPIALLDISKPRGNILIDELERLLAERLPDASFRRYTKPTYTKPAPEDLRRDILRDCGFVIEALAD